MDNRPGLVYHGWYGPLFVIPQDDGSVVHHKCSIAYVGDGKGNGLVVSGFTEFKRKTYPDGQSENLMKDGDSDYFFTPIKKRPKWARKLAKRFGW